MSSATQEAASLRERLMEQALRKPVRYVTQLDGFADMKPDCVMHPDPDGDCLMCSYGPELRSTDIPVRVQIMDGTTPERAVRLLRKLTAWMERNGESLIDYGKSLPEECPF